MNIYVGHSREHNFKEELYKPLRESNLNTEYSIILPHENTDEPFNSKEYFRKSCDLVLAEVSHKSSGLGVELGWADMLDVPIICIHKQGTKPPNSLKVLTNRYIIYSTEKDLIEKLNSALITINSLVEKKQL